jgi:hypothetical protein
MAGNDIGSPAHQIHRTLSQVKAVEVEKAIAQIMMEVQRPDLWM